MIVHNFDPVLVDFGFIQIRWYSIAYIVGITLGWLYAIIIIKKTSTKHNIVLVNTKSFDDLIIYLIFGIIIGGRLGYVFFYDFNYFIENYIEILKIWKGGMSFHGGLFGVIIATLFFAKNKKISFFKFTDIISCVAPIGLFMGRIANFINGELIGKTTNLPWAVIFPGGGNMPRHPSQLYEAFLEGVLLFILINYLALKKNFLLKTGYISAIFLIFYSLLRIFVENFREPDSHLGYYFNYFSMGTLLSIITLAIGCLIIFLLKKNEQNN
tara:strand:+ start:21 stop:827 length:807 start_codon:yes stop_codon:yes gene_type:complete